MQVALGADFRVVNEQAQLSIMESKWGIMPDMGGFASLRSLMPKDQAMLLTMTAKVIDAKTAKNLGLVTMLTNTASYSSALQLANQLIENTSDATGAIKQLMNTQWFNSKGQILANETSLQTKILKGAKFKEIVKKNLSRSAQTQDK